ncbi:Protein of unknown function DUF318, transmembrane [Desulfurobacterium thermolithotrophum DSM 11699]|uniref:Permease n=1 Tax=Desulfurobacterium thermolithotrophum (strain DSM 11699 / BSA) TaxID=868864 RepID=F0S296_DESTD|nr:Protein of unknown function DUF318, transmembrane [Desulfurobacterium thermolithotrophum DSM 11699]
MFRIHELLANWVVYNLLNLKAGERLTEAIHFFIYDTLKIFTLLVVIIFLISFVRSYFPLEKTRRILSRYKTFSYPLAAFLGVFTPFCSCSAVPMFIGFVEAGIPIGSAFSFLVASPMVNEIAIGLLLAIFGWKATLLYITLGLVVAVIAGIFIDTINPRSLIADYVFEIKIEHQEKERSLSIDERVKFAWSTVKEILSKVWLYILVAIAIGGFIHGYVPESLIENIMKKGNIWSVPLAVLLGIPLYSNSAGILPVIQALVNKGVPIGTALAFMMATTALSFPEFLILKQIMKTRLIVIFASIVGVSIIFVGYFFNFFLN